MKLLLFVFVVCAMYCMLSDKQDIIIDQVTACALLQANKNFITIDSIDNTKYFQIQLIPHKQPHKQFIKVKTQTCYQSQIYQTRLQMILTTNSYSNRRRGHYNLQSCTPHISNAFSCNVIKIFLNTFREYFLIRVFIK